MYGGLEGTATLFLPSRLFFALATSFFSLATFLGGARDFFFQLATYLFVLATFFLVIGDVFCSRRLHFCIATLFLYRDFIFVFATLFLNSRLYFCNCCRKCVRAHVDPAIWRRRKSLRQLKRYVFLVFFSFFLLYPGHLFHRFMLSTL